MRRRAGAFLLTTCLALTGAACGGDESSDPPDTSLLEPGDQQGSGADGSTVENPPGAEPGGSGGADEE